jgi:peptidoglycan/xylan/chitin deacetylase (PgdA/CDA1 family)
LGQCDLARLTLLFCWLACVACAPAPTPRPVPPAPSAAAPVPTSASLAPVAIEGPIPVAITIDDLPRHGPDVPGVSRLSIHQRILDVLAKHRTPPVYGFVNGHWLEKHPEERESLALWVKSGHPLGNHSYSHPDLFSGISDAAYLVDVKKNEPLLESLMGSDPERSRAWHVYRYPFLREGRDLESRAAIRSALLASGYVPAPATIDFFDWAYQPAYARCLAKKDEESMAALRTDYIDQAAFALRWSDNAARELVGRRTAQILLLHVGHFTALMLDELLTAYEKNGVAFVDLRAALADPVFSQEPKTPKVTFGSFWNQVRKGRDARSPAMAPPPDTLLERICR